MPPTKPKPTLPGAWGNQWPQGLGRIVESDVAQLFQREPVS
jgi:hypothetical protein